MTDFEREDMELAAIMGGRFTDETQNHSEEAATKPDSKPEPVKPIEDTPAEEKPRETLWKPVKPAPNFMDKLKATAKDVCLYGAISLILFWWQQTGRIDETTSWYALIVCVGMVFFSIGKHCRGDK